MALQEETHYTLDVPHPPEQVIRALVDFSDRRRLIWPETSHPAVYRVHALSETSADVTEGLPMSWSREHYDWSQPGRVLLRQVDSNMATPGGVIEYRISPTPNGCRIECDRRRSFIGVRGHLLGGIMVLFGRRLLRSQLRKGLDRAAHLGGATAS
jgi:hypothetical protein